MKVLTNMIDQPNLPRDRSEVEDVSSTLINIYLKQLLGLMDGTIWIICKASWNFAYYE